jgi:hypothetical protein
VTARLAERKNGLPTATDDDGGDLPVSCWPRSMVVCAATDASGLDTVTAEFTVTVKRRR